MSWTRAGRLAREKADKFDGVRTVSEARMDAMLHKLHELDREALIEWLHRRIAMEYRGFSSLCQLNARGEEITLPDIPLPRRLPMKQR